VRGHLITYLVGADDHAAFERVPLSARAAGIATKVCIGCRDAFADEEIGACSRRPRRLRQRRAYRRSALDAGSRYRPIRSSARPSEFCASSCRAADSPIRGRG